MNYLDYISYKLMSLGILEEYEKYALILDTYSSIDGKIEYTLREGKYSHKNYLIKNYIYFYSAYIEEYGIDELRVENSDEIIKNMYNSNLNYMVNFTTINEPVIEIDNNIKFLKPNITFRGTYEGEYSDMNILDEDWPFYVVVNIKGIKIENNYFREYSDSFAKILECIENLKNEKYAQAFIDAYVALELLIRKVENIDFLEPKQTKSVLISNGFYKNQAKKIIAERNDSIHPSSYGFFEDDKEVKVSLKYVLKAYFYYFNRCCI